MRTVMYKNDNAIFDFVLSDVIDRLKYYSDQKVHEATEILDAIASSPSETVKVESDYFGYIVLDLIKADKGHAYCKVCKETYDPSQLTSRPLGFGKSPFSINLEEGGVKTGEWLQLSCGVEDAFPVKMGELVMERKERVYTYSKAITSYILVTDALFGFKYLKSLSQ